MPTPIKLAAARYRALHDRPYMAAAIWALSPVEVSGFPTMGVDKHWRLYYGPEILEEWTVHQIAAVLYHEIGHLLRDHPARAEALGVEMDPFTSLKWNCAADAELNDDLVKEGVKLPGEPVLPASLGMPDGLMAEQYYLSAPDEKIDKRLAAPDAVAVPGEGKCGSCAGGAAKPWELKDPESSGGLSKSDGSNVRRTVAHQIREQAAGRGSVPAGWRRWAEELLEPKVNWKRALAGALRRSVADCSGRVDLNWRKPSRRQSLFPDRVVPAWRMPTPSVAVLVDTSGSMGDKQIGQALAEIDGIIKAMGMSHRLTVLFVDAAVHAVKSVFSAKQLEPVGGGGTDMRVGIEHVRRMSPRPDILVVLTDCDTPWPDYPPRECRTIIGRIGRGRVPAWAKVIDIE